MLFFSGVSRISENGTKDGSPSLITHLFPCEKCSGTKDFIKTISKNIPVPSTEYATDSVVLKANEKEFPLKNGRTFRWLTGLQERVCRVLRREDATTTHEQEHQQ